MQLTDSTFRLKRGEICPGDTLAVLAPNRKRERDVFAMRWGYRIGSDSKRLVFNARSETAGVKRMFRDSFQCRRCLIPASAYFEWDQPQKYLFSLSSEPVMYLAGLYRIEEGQAVCTILTRRAEGGAADFHDRMPLILPESLHEQWLLPAAAPDLPDILPSLLWKRA